MNLLETIQGLIRFRTETGNLSEIDKCMTYCQNLFKNSGAYIDVCRYKDVSPVLFIRNKDVDDFDVIFNSITFLLFVRFFIGINILNLSF